MSKMIYKYKNSHKFEDVVARDKRSTVRCECGNSIFYLNWISAPYTGGFGKITCSKCGNEDIIIDDYA